MDRINEALIDLLSASTGCTNSKTIWLDADEWQRLYKEAIDHQVHFIIFSEANKYGSSTNPQLFDTWRNTTILYSLYAYNTKFQILKDLFAEFKKSNIPIIALKGLYFKSLYKEPELRTMGDIDLLTEPEAFEKAVDIIKSFGYKVNDNKDESKHICFVHDSYIMIELHFSLVTETKRKIASKFNEEIWESAVSFSSDEIEYLIPSEINHLVYCCIHMTNHLGKGGFGFRQLMDFNLLVRKNSDTIDWVELFRQANFYGVGKFIEILLLVCHKLFHLEVPQLLLVKYTSDSEMIDRLIELLIDSGVFGRKDLKTTLNRSLATYLAQENKKVRSFNLRYLFPQRANLSFDYSYAQKHAILLPVAWVHRIIKNIYRSDLSIHEKMPDSDSIKQYYDLFKWLDIK